MPGLRIFAVSDIHTDYAANLRWCDGLPAEEYRDDVLILAGDVSDDLPTLRQTLAVLKARFAHVFFTPGNHDLWVRRGERGKYDSIGKLRRVLDLCAELGVAAAPACIAGVWIVPLLSWYHATWDREPDIPGALPVTKMMVDFHACSWPRPELNAEDASLAEYFDAMNDKPLRPVLAALQQKHAPALGRTQSPGPQRTQPSAPGAAADGTAHSAAVGPAGGPGSDAQPAADLGRQRQQAGAAAADGPAATAAAEVCPDSSGGASDGRQTRPPIITFSHYLPHQELLPEKRLLRHPNLAKAVGSDPLAARIAQLQPDCHIFGHTHFSWDVRLPHSPSPRTRFVQWPLAYPAEQKRRGPGSWRPLLVFDAARGGVTRQVHTYWGSQYAQPGARNPQNVHPAPWCCVG